MMREEFFITLTSLNILGELATSTGYSSPLEGERILGT